MEEKTHLETFMDDNNLADVMPKRKTTLTAKLRAKFSGTMGLRSALAKDDLSQGKYNRKFIQLMFNHCVVSISCTWCVYGASRG